MDYVGGNTHEHYALGLGDVFIGEEPLLEQLQYPMFGHKMLKTRCS